MKSDFFQALEENQILPALEKFIDILQQQIEHKDYRSAVQTSGHITATLGVGGLILTMQGVATEKEEENGQQKLL